MKNLTVTIANVQYRSILAAKWAIILHGMGVAFRQHPQAGHLPEGNYAQSWDFYLPDCGHFLRLTHAGVPDPQAPFYHGMPLFLLVGFPWFNGEIRNLSVYAHDLGTIRPHILPIEYQLLEALGLCWTQDNRERLIASIGCAAVIFPDLPLVDPKRIVDQLMTSLYGDAMTTALLEGVLDGCRV